MTNFKLIKTLVLASSIVVLAACDNEFRFNSLPSLESGQEAPTPICVMQDQAPEVSGPFTVYINEPTNLRYPLTHVQWTVSHPSGDLVYVGNRLEIIFDEEGTYPVLVEGFDSCDNFHSSSFHLIVISRPQDDPHDDLIPYTDEFTIQSNGEMIDIIMIIDNSPSMREEQRRMADRFRNFIDTLEGLDWQLAIITTHAKSGNQPWAYGRFAPFERFNNSPYINADTPNLEDVFSRNVRRRETGTSDEEGIKNMYLAIQRPENQFFFREHAHLVSIIVSDEDERSNGTRLRLENTPENLLETIAAQFGPQKTYTHHSIIHEPGIPFQCRQVGDHFHGVTYARLSELTGGVTGDICDNDYAETLENIGEDIKQDSYSAALRCAPVGSVEVTLTPMPDKTIRYGVIGNKLKLIPYPPKGTQVKVDYFCE